jgi:hypothetical protein
MKVLGKIMRITIQAVVVVVLCLIATSSWATSTTWAFNTDSSDYDIDAYDTEFGNQLTIDTDDDGNPELNISAWSDTGCGWYCGDDRDIFNAFASTDSQGLLNYNRDNPNAIVDGEYAKIDSFSGDFDMMLFSFSDSVSLTGISLASIGYDSDVSIAAFSSLPTLTSSTWSSVATAALFSTSFANFNNGINDITNLSDSNNVVEAQYWLIGAYNAVFTDAGPYVGMGNDAFKLASITTEPSAVSEPAIMLIFASGLMLIWLRRKNH